METALTSRELRDESRALVLAPTAVTEGGGACVPEVARPTDRHVLQVTYERPPSAVVEDWLTHHGEPPASLAVVGPTEEDAAALPADVHVTTVAPDDLTGVGIAVGRYLDRWEGTPMVCVDSLTALLDHVDQDRLFRFMHTLTGRFVAAGAAAHVHLDPSTQDERTVATLATLFESVVRYEDGTWRVERS
jgi:hypothetical protein